MNKIFEWLLDLIFPKFCLGCGLGGIWLCQKCYKKINKLNTQCCPVCRKKGSGQVCNNCKESTPLDGLLVSCVYDKSLITKLIKFYKYQYIRELSLPLAVILVKTITNNHLNNSNTIIIGVPLHKKRFSERGYNQSALMAKIIAKKTELLYYENLLKRKKNTLVQARLSKKQRIINLKSAFSVSNKFDFHGKNVIIIDDVATTLATLNSCAELLKRAGANKIWGVVIAQGS